MADETAEVLQSAEKSSSSAGTIKLVIAGIVIIILAAGISFGVAMFAAKSVSGGEAPKAEQNGKAMSDSLGTTYDAGEYITNLASEGGGFIKVKIVFAFPDPKIQEEITNKAPQIQHTINSILRQQKADALAEPKGMEKLADLLKKSINSQLVKGNITNVYFTSFVVQ